MSVSRVLLLTALAATLSCGRASPPPANEPAPEFDLALVGGGNVTLASLHGKTVLIDFWATWCPPCVTEVPEINAISKELQGTDAAVLAISVDSLTEQALSDWLKERDVTYPVALGDSDLAGLYGADAFPFHVVVSPDGRIVERLESGFHDREQLRAVLARHRKR